MRALLFLLLFVPVSAIAAGELVYVPESPQTVTGFSEPTVEQYFYGELTDYPHTFTFQVTEPTELNVLVSIPKNSEYKKSIIVVREEKRGVSEIGRVTYKETSWTDMFDWRLGRGFLDAEQFTAQVEAGTYRLEVSSPDNHGKYKLRVGTEKNRQWFFTRLKERAAGASFFGNSWLAALRAPLVSLTLTLVLVLGYFVVRWLRRRHG